MAHRTLEQQLEALREQLAAAAQAVVDDWQQDEEGYDEEYGEGGVCDAVAQELAGVIADAVDDVDFEEGGWEGDDHAWLLVRRGAELYAVDIPPGVYETGAGYRWRKREDAVVEPDDVIIEAVERVD